MDIWVWILIIIVIAAVFLLLAGYVLPKLLFRARYDVQDSNDRGIKKIDGDGGQSLVFEPQLETRKYIKSYALIDRDGKRVLVCKLNGKISYIDYDVIVFADGEKAHRVFNVKDAVDGNEYTKVVELPANTEYVSIMINEADGEVIKHKVVKSISTKRMVLFILLSAVLITLSIFGIKACCAYAFGGLFAESFTVLWKSNAVTAIIAVCAVALDIILTVAAFFAMRAGQKAGKNG